MITVLVDHNIEGQATLLFATLQALEWADLLGIRFIRFSAIDLPTSSSDRMVWNTAQLAQMLLLTANRSMTGADSLEQVIREENTAASLPVLTVSDVERLADSIYREECADRLAEIVAELELYRGTGRLYLP